ncbi:MAG: homoserine dehydrogenase [Clostridia bacterium]|nr:homoserine dehydrogenase [Clostridia bacterium]
MAKIAVLGYGTVGSGVVEVLSTNSSSIATRAGQPIEVKSVLDIRDFPGDPIQEKIVHDIDDIVNDPEIDVVVEVMGGVEPAFTFVKKALDAGKSVCTSNKALVAAHGPELLEMAKERKLNFMFEASVGGGIPIIRPLNQSLTADEITKITGILNGTTNYILTKMSKEGSSYEETLKEAQELGYAERNPEADVEGYDACRKIAILTSLAYGSTVNFEEVTTEGISKISTADFKYAEKLGCVVKLLATSYRKDGKVYVITAPFMIDSTHPLYNVNDVLNGIYVNGNVLGNVMFFGAGAGKLPTASAVVADVVDCVKHKGTNVMTVWAKTKLELGKTDDEVREFFVRIKGDASRDADAVKAAFGDVSVITVDGIEGEFGFVTGEMTEKTFNEAAKKFSVINRIRIDKTILK